jgi:hypothetical protein
MFCFAAIAEIPKEDPRVASRPSVTFPVVSRLDPDFVCRSIIVSETEQAVW